MSRPTYLPARNLELRRPLTLAEEHAYARQRAIRHRQDDRWAAVLRRIEAVRVVEKDWFRGMVQQVRD
jgi:hypothetical protein